MADVNNHNAYSLADIQRYLQGSMSTKEMHELERAALEDPFLADALEGYSVADMEQSRQHLAQIETAIRGQQHRQGKIVALPALKKYRFWQIAASVILLISIAGATYFMFNTKSNNVPLAKNESSSTVLKADSAQPSRQSVMSQLADSATPATPRQTSEEHKKLLAVNNHKEKRTQQVHTPETKTSVQKTADAGNASITAMGYGKISQDTSNLFMDTVANNDQQSALQSGVVLPGSPVVIADKNKNARRFATVDSSAVAANAASRYRSFYKQHSDSVYNNNQLRERALEPDDIEVINIGRDKKTGDTTAVMPQGGWQSFQEYVYKRLHRKYDSVAKADIYMSGGLQLEFSISDAGEPVDFKVIHAPDAQTAEEAISTIKTGPRWINSNKRNKMRIRVKY